MVCVYICSIFWLYLCMYVCSVLARFLSINFSMRLWLLFWVLFALASTKKLLIIKRQHSLLLLSQDLSRLVSILLFVVAVVVVGSQMPIAQLTIALQITEQMIRQHNYRRWTLRTVSSLWFRLFKVGLCTFLGPKNSKLNQFIRGSDNRYCYCWGKHFSLNFKNW